jgi:type III secretory pathway component EscV
MTNEWLQGYLAALKNIDAFCNTHKLGQNYDSARALHEVRVFIEQVENNYRQLVKELNDGSKSKKT